MRVRFRTSCSATLLLNSLEIGSQPRGVPFDDLGDYLHYLQQPAQKYLTESTELKQVLCSRQEIFIHIINKPKILVRGGNLHHNRQINPPYINHTNLIQSVKCSH